MVSLCKGNKTSPAGIKFILILCGGGERVGSKQASDVGRQIRQAEVMLKSAAMFTKEPTPQYNNCLVSVLTKESDFRNILSLV